MVGQNPDALETLPFEFSSVEVPAEPEPSSPTLHYSPTPKDETPEILRLPTLVLGEEGEGDSHEAHDSSVLSAEGPKSPLPAASGEGVESGGATVVAGAPSESGEGDQARDVPTVPDVDHEKAEEKPDGIQESDVAIPQLVADGEFNAMDHQDFGSYKHINLSPSFCSYWKGEGNTTTPFGILDILMFESQQCSNVNNHLPQLTASLTGANFSLAAICWAARSR